MIGRRASHIKADHLLVAARGMRAHLELLQDKPVLMSKAEVLATALRDVVLDGRGQKIDELHDHVC